VRVRHKALETERAYVGWVERFIQHYKFPDLASFGEREIKAFLTDVAVERDVTAGTQNQAKCALLFLYQTVLGRELGFLDVGPATKPSRLPVVLSRPEIGPRLPEFRGLRLLMSAIASARNTSWQEQGTFKGSAVAHAAEWAFMRASAFSSAPDPSNARHEAAAVRWSLQDCRIAASSICWRWGFLR